MKKLIAVVLCLLIVASLCFTVFANDGAAPAETKSPSVTTPTVAPTEKPGDPDSPSTGTNNWAVALAVAFGVGGAFLATKKLIKSK